MNKMRRPLVAALVSLTSISAFAQDAAPPTAAPAASTGAPPAALIWQIVEAKGAVEMRANEKAAWAKAETNQNLAIGAAVRTGADGKASIKAGDVAGANLTANTSVEIASLTREGDTTKSEVKALTGKALFLVNKLKTEQSSFKVQTPTAIVGVRGTAFGVQIADNAESSRIACFTGEVSVRGTGAEQDEVVLKEKTGTNVVKNKKPTPPEALPDNELTEWERVKAEVQTSTMMASVVPAIGGMIEAHQIMNAEADRVLDEANRARRGNKKADEDFKVYEAALMKYFRDVKDVPTKEAGLDALLNDPKVAGWKGPYLGAGSNLLDPYGRPYKFLHKKSPDGKDVYEIRSGGPDGIVGNTDDHFKMITRTRFEKTATEAK